MESPRKNSKITQNENELDRFFDLSVNLHCIAQADGYFTRVNRAFEEILGYPREELLSKPFLDLIHPDDLQPTLDAMSVLSEGKDVIDFENRYIDSAGNTHWFSWRASMDMETERIYAVAREITEGKNTQEELRNSQLMLRAVIDTVPNWLFIKNLDCQYTMVNKSMANFYGKTPDEFINTRFADVSYDNPEHVGVSDDSDRRVLENNEVVEVTDMIVKSADGEDMLRYIIKLPLRDEKGELVGLVGTSIDTTVRNRLENQLRQSQKMEAVGQLAGGVAHDFNNMLQVILGYCHIAMEEDGTPEQNREFLKYIMTSAEAARDLTRQLLTFSRQEVMASQDVSVNDLIGDLMKLMARLIGEHIDLVVIPGKDELVIHADRGLLDQVIMNLCVNARDAMPKGGTLTIKTDLVPVTAAMAKKLDISEAGDYVRISIEDTGTGIAEKDRERIFDPFFTTKEAGKGTGLGLSLVYGIIQQHHGGMEVISHQGQGTRFNLYFKISDTQGEQPQKQVVASPQPGSETILLAEDEQAVRTFARTLLEKNGYKVLVAEDGEAAINLFKAHKNDIHLALLDVVMPKMSGRDVYEVIIGERPDLPVVFCTGYAADNMDSDFLETRGISLINKPYAPRTLLTELRKILGAVNHGDKAGRDANATGEAFRN